MRHWLRNTRTRVLGSLSDAWWRARGAARELAGWLVLAAVLSALVGLAYFEAPDRVIEAEDFKPAKNADPAPAPSAADLVAARNQARTAGVAVIAGLGAALAAAFAGRTYYLSRRGQASDRYIKAVEQFENDDKFVRMAALYALEQIAHDSRRDHRPIMELVAAFLRTSDRSGEEPPVDVQAACTVLTRRRTGYDRGMRLDLTGADLRGVQLDGVNLRHADLREARLDGAFMRTADLSNANLFNAIAPSARFDRARLRRTTLTGAELQLAAFSDADLQRAELEDAELETTFFEGADLRKTTGLMVDWNGPEIRNAEINDKTKLPRRPEQR